MIALFLASFVVIALAVGGMAIGVLCGRRPIAGSCGGLNAQDGGEGCSACASPCAARAARSRAAAAVPSGADGSAGRAWFVHQSRGARAADTGD